MAAAATPEACLKYIAGQVVVLRQRPGRDPTEATRSRLELGELVDSTPLEPSDAAGRYRAIELVRVPVGLELRYIETLSVREDVIATSLNYTGSSAQADIDVVGPEVHQSSWFTLGQSGSSLEAGLCDLSGKRVVVSVDVDGEHALDVLSTARKMQLSIPLADVEFIAIHAPVTESVVGLYQYAKAFGRLIEITCRELVVVMPVDFGRIWCARGGSREHQRGLRRGERFLHPDVRERIEDRPARVREKAGTDASRLPVAGRLRGRRESIPGWQRTAEAHRLPRRPPGVRCRHALRPGGLR